MFWRYLYIFIKKTQLTLKMNVALHQSTIFDGLLFLKCFFNNDSVVGTLPRLQNGRPKIFVRFPVHHIFLTPNSPYRLWNPSSLLLTGYRKLYPGGKAAGTCIWTFPFIYVHYTSNFLEELRYVTKKPGECQADQKLKLGTLKIRSTLPFHVSVAQWHWITIHCLTYGNTEKKSAVSSF